MTSDVIKKILHAVLVDKRKYADVAVQFRVTKTLICRLKKKHDAEGCYIEDLESKECKIMTKLQATI